MTTDQDIERAKRIIDRITPILADKPPEIVGAVLADLLATLLAGYPRQAREEILQTHIEGMRPLIEVNERIRFGDAGHPYNAKEH